MDKAAPQLSKSLLWQTSLQTKRRSRRLNIVQSLPTYSGAAAGRSMNWLTRREATKRPSQPQSQNPNRRVFRLSKNTDQSTEWFNVLFGQGNFYQLMIYFFLCRIVILRFFTSRHYQHFFLVAYFVQLQIRHLIIYLTISTYCQPTIRYWLILGGVNIRFC